MSRTYSWGQVKFRLVLDLEAGYDLSYDPTSMIGYDIENHSFNGFMSLSSYDNYSNIVKLGKGVTIDEMAEGDMRSFRIFVPVGNEQDYSVQLLLHSNAFEKATNIWSPEGVDAYDIEGSEDKGTAHITGTLTLKNLKNSNDLSINNSYAWKVFVTCALSWRNGAERVSFD